MADFPGFIADDTATLLLGVDTFIGPRDLILDFEGLLTAVKLPPRRGWVAGLLVNNGLLLEDVRDSGFPPGKAIITFPLEDGTDIPVQPRLLWADGGFTHNYDVYVNDVLISLEHGDNFLDLPFPLDYESVNTWRVDSRNTHGVTVGDTWTFTTEPPPIDVVPPRTRPESPILEHLEFRTQINRRKNGTEERISLRRSPRTVLELRIADDHQYMDSYLLGRAGANMAMPLWWEPAFLSAPAEAGDTILWLTNRHLTQFDGQHVFITDGASHEVCLVNNVFADHLVLARPLVNTYVQERAEVFPVHLAFLDHIQATRRMSSAMYDMKLTLAPAVSPLGETLYADGELVVSDVNFMPHLSNSFHRPGHRVDSGVGGVAHYTWLDHSDIGSMLGFRTYSREQLLALRTMLHRLSGRAVAFWLAAFEESLTPVADIIPGDNILDIAYCGYTEFVQGRRGTIRIHTDTEVLQRTVTSSEVISPTVERLRVHLPWVGTIPVDSIRRIEYLDLVRLDTDDVIITHVNALGWASCEVPIIHVDA